MRLLPTLLNACALLLFLTVTPLSGAHAQTGETNFTIYVKAHDGKFIGTSMGGARITVTDRRTGDLLASGTTYGSAEGSEALMNKQASGRDAILVAPETAKFAFSLELFEPVPVTITATGPIAQPQSLATVSKDMLLIPGKDYTSGNGIILEIPGFAVDVLSPPPSMTLKHDEETPIVITANITKMDGSPLTKDGEWPIDRYQVEAHVYKGSRWVGSMPLEYAGQPGLFQSKLKIPKAGPYMVTVTAYDPQTKEAGIDSTGFTLVEENKE